MNASLLSPIPRVSYHGLEWKQRHCAVGQESTAIQSHSFSVGRVTICFLSSQNHQSLWMTISRPDNAEYARSNTYCETWHGSLLDHAICIHHCSQLLQWDLSVKDRRGPIQLSNKYRALLWPSSMGWDYHTVLEDCDHHHGTPQFFGCTNRRQSNNRTPRLSNLLYALWWVAQVSAVGIGPLRQRQGWHCWSLSRIAWC